AILAQADDESYPRTPWRPWRTPAASNTGGKS
ncbi:MAG: hypothetical protein QOI76_3676, partial [Frankiales bacterium]|nr:hypothetical protein [Frankiales bacterium]